VTAVRHPALSQPPFAPLTPGQAKQFRALVAAALEEDGAGNDVTSSSAIDPLLPASADLIFRAGGVVAGLELAHLAFTVVDPNMSFMPRSTDGEPVGPDTTIASAAGTARGLLASERVALNFIGRLSGIATLTRSLVDAVRGLPVRICDTRKTTPCCDLSNATPCVPAVATTTGSTCRTWCSSKTTT
jgi:nicotinate-nucleotide pyrophosphorylase